MSQREQADELYSKHYKSLKLAPKHVVALKDVLLKAVKKGLKPRAEARKWFKEKGIELPSKADSESEVADKKATAMPKKEEEKPKPSVDYTKLDLKNLDRKSLKATVMELLSAGVKVKVPVGDDGTPRVKKMQDHELLRAVSEALNSLPSPDTLAMLESIDPKKLETSLKHDCLGIYVDLTTPECIACPDKGECAKQFIKNLKGNFKVFKDAMTDIKTEEAAKTVTDVEADAVKKDKDKTNKVRRLKYKADTQVFVMNIKNPEKKSSDAYEMVAAILAQTDDDTTFAVISLKDLHDIVTEHFDYTTTALMEELVPQLRQEGVLKFIDDLTADEREAYEEALKEAE